MGSGNYTQLFIILAAFGLSFLSWLIGKLKEQAQIKRMRDQIQRQQEAELRTGRSSQPVAQPSRGAELQELKELAARRQAQLRELRESGVPQRPGMPGVPGIPGVPGGAAPRPVPRPMNAPRPMGAPGVPTPPPIPGGGARKPQQQQQQWNNPRPAPSRQDPTGRAGPAPVPLTRPEARGGQRGARAPQNPLIPPSAATIATRPKPSLEDAVPPGAPYGGAGPAAGSIGEESLLRSLRGKRLSVAEIRRAIVLNEILSPPLSLGTRERAG